MRIKYTVGLDRLRKFVYFVQVLNKFICYRTYYVFFMVCGPQFEILFF